MTPDERRAAQRRVVFLAPDERNLLWDPPAKPARPPATASDAAIVRVLLPPTRTATRADRTSAQLLARQWSDCGFTATEVRAWLAAGIQPDESRLAVDCRVEGIAPATAGDVYEDPDSGEHVTALQAVRRGRGSAMGERDLERELDRMRIARTRNPAADGLLGFRRRRLG